MVKCIFLSEQHCRFLDICQHLGAQLDIISCHINNITHNIAIITLHKLNYRQHWNLIGPLQCPKACVVIVCSMSSRMQSNCQILIFEIAWELVKDHFGQTTFKITTRTFTHSQFEYKSFLVTIFAAIWDQFKRLQSNFLKMVVYWSMWWEDDVQMFPSVSRDVTHATTVVSDLTFMKLKRQICSV